MLTMTQVDDIRNAFFAKGLNISEIAREFKRDRKTVRKYIIQDDWNITVTNREPKKACPKLDPYKADIDQWLEVFRITGSCLSKVFVPGISGLIGSLSCAPT